MATIPDPSYLLSHLELRYPLIGVYDAPQDTPFPDVQSFTQGKRQCLFSFFDRWCEGATLRLDEQAYGCGGCGHWWFGTENRTRQEYIEFLADTEGLRANHELMGAWFDRAKSYIPEHDAIFTGLIFREFYDYLKTVMFFADPDQLSILCAAAAYHAHPDDPEPVLAAFGSGCMQSLNLLHDLSIPQAIIGSTDLAMRRHLPNDIIIFTVTRPMYERLCSLDEHSFLGKSFLRTLKKARVIDEDG
jgi:hypothetical protein